MNWSTSMGGRLLTLIVFMFAFNDLIQSVSCCVYTIFDESEFQSADNMGSPFITNFVLNIPIRDHIFIHPSSPAI